MIHKLRAIPLPESWLASFLWLEKTCLGSQHGVNFAVISARRGIDQPNFRFRAGDDFNLLCKFFYGAFIFVGNIKDRAAKIFVQ